MANFSSRLLPLTVSVPVMTDWVSYTPTGPWTGGNVSYTGQWRRLGDSINIRLDASFSGAPTGTSASFTATHLLGSLGLSIDTAKIPTASASAQAIGNWTVLDSGVAVYNGNMAFESTTTINAFITTGSLVSATNPITLGAADNFTMDITLPITGWTSYAPSAATANAIVNGGNTFGGTLTLGTRDNQPISFLANNAVVGGFSAAGALTAGPTASLTTPHIFRNQATTDYVARFDNTAGGAGATARVLLASSGTNAQAKLVFSPTGTGTSNIQFLNSTGWQFENTAGTVIASQTDAGAWTLGPSGFTGTHNVRGVLAVTAGIRTSTFAFSGGGTQTVLNLNTGETWQLISQASNYGGGDNRHGVVAIASRLNNAATVTITTVSTGFGTGTFAVSGSSITYSAGGGAPDTIIFLTRLV